MLQEKLPTANTTCEVCGTKYYACKKCIELVYKGTYGWKLTCCSHACFQLKMLLDSYERGELDGTQAKEFVDTLCFPVESDRFQPKYKQFVVDINIPKKKKRIKNKPIEDQ